MTYASTILADTPKAYWPITESGVSIGSVYADATGNGYDVAVTTGHLTHISSPVTGETAVYMPDTPNYDALIGNVTLGFPVTAQPYTLEGWVKPDRFYYYMEWIAYGPLNYSGPFNGSDMRNQVGGNTFLETWNPFNGDGDFVTPLNDGIWHYVVITDDGAGNLKMYVDNVNVFSDSGIGTTHVTYNAGNVISLGDAGNVGGTWVSPAQEEYTGGLSNMAIYDYVLTPTKINNHWTAMGYVPSPNLSLSPSNGFMGDTINVSGSHFTPSSTVTISFNGVVQGTHAVTVGGTFTGFTFTVPTYIPGNYNVVGDDGTLSDTETFTVKVAEVDLDATHYNIGVTATVDGFGFLPSTGITVKRNGTTVLATTTSDANGHFEITFVVSRATITYDDENDYVLATDGTSNPTATYIVNGAEIVTTPNPAGSGAATTVDAYNLTPLSSYTLVFGITDIGPVMTNANGRFTVVTTVPATPWSYATLLVTASDVNGAVSGVHHYDGGYKIDLNQYRGAPGDTIGGQVKNHGLSYIVWPIRFNGVIVSYVTDWSCFFSGCFGNFTFPVQAGPRVSEMYYDASFYSITIGTYIFLHAGMTLSQYSGIDGITITISGGGFLSSTSTNLTWDGVFFDTVMTDSEGRFTYNYVIPADPLGSHIITANDGTNIVNQYFNIKQRKNTATIKVHAADALLGVPGTGIGYTARLIINSASYNDINSVRHQLVDYGADPFAGGDTDNYPDGYPQDIAIFYGATQIDCWVLKDTPEQIIIEWKLQANIAAGATDTYTLKWGLPSMTLMNDMLNVYLWADNFNGSSLQSGYTLYHVTPTVSGNVLTLTTTGAGDVDPSGIRRSIPGTADYDASVDVLFNTDEGPSWGDVVRGGVGLRGRSGSDWAWEWIVHYNNFHDGYQGFLLDRITWSGGGDTLPGPLPANTWAEVRFQFIGTSDTADWGPVTNRAKAWLSSNKEPDGWISADLAAGWGFITELYGLTVSSFPDEVAGITGCSNVSTVTGGATSFRYFKVRLGIVNAPTVSMVGNTFVAMIDTTI